jgi:hypothetical protein
MLDQNCPKARIVYSSATGATDVRTWGISAALACQGPGTAFDNFSIFQREIERDGIAAMETVARDLKARACIWFLSFESTKVQRTGA